MERSADADYFEVIEAEFVRLRGKHLFVSPQDWALIESWKAAAVPVHVVLRAIKETFEKFKSNNRNGTISSLSYCAPAVKEVYDQWLTSRVGANDSESTLPPADPFSQEEILKHIQRCRAALTAPWNSRPASVHQAAEATEAALGLLQSEAGRSGFNARAIEERLSTLERNLDEAIKHEGDREVYLEMGEAVTAQLAQYKRHMDEGTYQQTFETLMMRKLREHFGIPRLSLFFI